MTGVEEDYEFCPSVYILGYPKSRPYFKTSSKGIQTSIMFGKQIIMRRLKAVEGPLFQE